MKRYTVLFVCLIAVVFASVSINAPSLYAQGFTGPGSQVSQTVISADRAMQIALDRAGGGRVTEVEWERKNWGSQYDVEIHHNGMEVEVKIDGATGEIISYKEKRASARFVMPPQPDRNQISFERARDTALNGRSNAVVEEVEWKHRYGQWVYEITLRQNGRKDKVYLDAATGRALQRGRTSWI